MQMAHRERGPRQPTPGCAPRPQEASLDDFFAEAARKGQPERQSKRERSAPLIYGDSDDDEPKSKGKKEEPRLKKEPKVRAVGYVGYTSVTLVTERREAAARRRVTGIASIFGSSSEALLPAGR